MKQANRDQIVRESEQAAIERWFPTSPLGQLFDPGDGKLLHIRADDAQGWKQEGHALIDRFIAGGRAETRVLVVLFTALAIAVVSLSRWAGIRSGATVMAAVGLGALLLHIWPLLRLWRYRRALAALRMRIRAALVAYTPLPPELAGRFRRRNPWRIALHLWVFALLMSTLAAQHFLRPDAIPIAAVQGALVAVGIAWGLHFLSRRADRLT